MMFGFWVIVSVLHEISSRKQREKKNMQTLIFWRIRCLFKGKGYYANQKCFLVVGPIQADSLKSQQ